VCICNHYNHNASLIILTTFLKIFWLEYKRIKIDKVFLVT